MHYNNEINPGNVPPQLVRQCKLVTGYGGATIMQVRLAPPGTPLNYNLKDHPRRGVCFLTPSGELGRVEYDYDDHTAPREAVQMVSVSRTVTFRTRIKCFWEGNGGEFARKYQR
jgi:hypothetical protein